MYLEMVNLLADLNSSALCYDHLRCIIDIKNSQLIMLKIIKYMHGNTNIIDSYLMYLDKENVLKIYEVR